MGTPLRALSGDRSRTRQLLILILAAQTALLTIRFAVTGSFVAGDSAWQFATLRSIYMQRSLDLRDEAEFFYNERSPYTGNRKILRIQQSNPRTGLVATVWPVGAAVIRLPSFAVADIAARATSLLGIPVDRAGYRHLYQFLPALFSSALGSAGLLLLARTVRRSFADDGAVIAVATVWLATPVIYYLTIEPLMAHAVSLGLACCLVALVLRTREREEVTLGRFALLGCLCGLLTITRYQDAAYFLLPLTLASGQWRRAFFGVIAGAAPVVAVQLLANRIWYGSMWTTGYEGVVRAEWLAPDVWRHLFAPLYGVFTTHPIQLLGLAGLVWIYPIHKRLVLALYVIFATELYAVAALIPGAPGMSFGNRTLTSLTPAFALGWYGLRNRFPNLHPVGIALVCANVTLLALYCLRVINPS